MTSLSVVEQQNDAWILHFSSLFPWDQKGLDLTPLKQKFRAELSTNSKKRIFEYLIDPEKKPVRGEEEEWVVANKMRNAARQAVEADMRWRARNEE